METFNQGSKFSVNKCKESSGTKVNSSQKLLGKESSSLKKNISKTNISCTSVRPQVSFVDFHPHRQTSISHIFKTDQVVEDYLESIVLQNDNLAFIKNLRMVVRLDHMFMKDSVKILSGGSAGLEPLHSKFVGQGMLTAAIFGELPSSPPYLVILDALRLLSKQHTKGILVIVMNNLADRLNFGLACQQAAREGVNVMCVTVGEDCSGVGVDKAIGKRGLCGIVFLQKIAGAMSEEGKTLQEIFSVLMSLKGGSLGSINVHLASDGVYYGNGLKGEPGKFANYESITPIVNGALFYIFNRASYFSLHIEKGDNVAMIVNNLGKLSELKLTLVIKEIFNRMTFLGINIVRVYSGNFMSINNGLGFSISVLKLGHYENVLKWLDDPTSVSNWPGKSSDRSSTTVPFQDRCSVYVYDSSSISFTSDSVEVAPEEKNLGPRFPSDYVSTLVTILKKIVDTVIEMEDHLNMIDFDHDYGTSLKTFMRCLQKEINSRSLNILTPYGLFNSLAELAAASMGGATGAVYSIIFSSAAQAFLTSSKFCTISWEMWIEAARMAAEALQAYTRVRPGNRTVLDALHPFSTAFNSPRVASLRSGVNAAKTGAEDTKAMMGVHKYPDPGALVLAVALSVIFTELEADLMNLEAEEIEEAEEEEDSVWFCESCERFFQQERGQEVWYCDSCWGSLTKVASRDESLFYCDDCLQIMTEEGNKE